MYESFDDIVDHGPENVLELVSELRRLPPQQLETMLQEGPGWPTFGQRPIDSLLSNIENARAYRAYGDEADKCRAEAAERLGAAGLTPGQVAQVIASVAHLYERAGEKVALQGFFTELAKRPENLDRQR